MIVQALQFGSQYAQPAGGGGNGQTKGTLDRLTEGHAVCNRPRPGDLLGQEHCPWQGQLLKLLLHAAMLVARLHVDVQHILPGRRHHKLRSLEDAGAHRAIGDGEDAGTLHPQAGARLRLGGWTLLPSNLLAQGKHIRRPVRRQQQWPQIGMAFGLQTQHLGQFALVPGGGREHRR